MALQWLRDKVKVLAWILWLVVASFIVAIFFDFGGTQMQGAGEQVAATVGKHEISMEEFRQQYQQMESRYRQAFGERFNRDMARQFNLPVQALNQLIDRRILLMEAEDLGLRVTDGELADYIVTLPYFQDENGDFIGETDYRDRLKRARQGFKGFESSLRDDLLVNKLQRVLAGTVYVSEREVEAAYREQTEKAKVRFLQLPASELAGQVQVDPSEIDTYYETNKTDYEIGEQRIVDYLLIDTAKLRRAVEVPDEELRAYYDDNSDEFAREEQVQARHILLRETPERPTEQAREDLLAIRNRIEAGEDFTTLAKELSDDEGSATRGGSLGTFGRGSMVEAFEEAAFSATVGELVGPVKTNFGYHLIEVQSRTEGGLQPFEQASAGIRGRLVAERAEGLAEAKAWELAETIETTSLASAEDLKALVAGEDATFETTPAFGRDDIIPGIGRAGDFAEQAFTLADGEVSQPVKLPRGWAILRANETIAARIPDLSEVADQIRTVVQEEKQAAAALTRMAGAKDELAAGKSLEDVAKSLGLEIQESNEFGLRDSVTGLGRARELIAAALGSEQGAVVGPFEDPSGAVLAEVIERKIFDAVAFEEAKEATRQTTESEKLQNILASLVELRRRDLEPQHNRELLASFEIESLNLG